MRFSNRQIAAVGVMSLTLILGACGSSDDTASDTSTPVSNLSGTITLDGSSTVTPLMTLTAEDFQDANAGVRVTVGTSGTGGGFEKFCAGETDISMASRPIKDSEKEKCAAASIDPIEFIVANDALSVIVSNDSNLPKCLTIPQLKKMWSPESQGTVSNWNQVDPSFLDQKLSLFGAGSDSGTFDYFTEAVNGKAGSVRTDYSPSEDDNVTITGVAGDKGALGFLGLSYVLENKSKVKALEIDGGDGCVAPSAETVIGQTYKPLGRALYIYFKATSLAKPEVKAFAEYYQDHQDDLTKEALFIPLSEAQKGTQVTELEAIEAK